MAVAFVTESAAIAFREAVVPSDLDVVRQIVESTDFFDAPQIEVAVELVDERLDRGFSSGYYFSFAERAGRTIGFTCYGPIACTQASFDLYWIAVEMTEQRRGLGRLLVEESERQIRLLGGQRVYIETSNRPQYAPTRAFYERCGYRQEAVLAEFYAPGDDKVIYVKTL